MTAVLRLILTSAACFGLWRLWRAIDTIDRRAAMIAGVGLLIRLVAGQTLFWISWLKLPFARSLQLGSGLWFYAIDGQWYLQYADKILGQGPATVLTIDATYPSRVFVQVLTIAVAAFGHVASVALLLNAFAFLATCLVVVRLADPRGPARIPCLFALGALSLGPGAILWSLQPLKDTVLTIFAVAMLAACRPWQTAWRDRDGTATWWQAGASAVAMLAMMYAVSGIRWYFGAILWGACGAFLALTAITARRRWAASAAGAVLFLFLAQSFLMGGGDDVSPWVRRQLDLRTALTGSRPLPILFVLSETRRGFENTPGATHITSGTLPGPASAAPVPGALPTGPAAARPPAPAAPPAAGDLPQSPAPGSANAIGRAAAESPTRQTVRQVATGIAALVLPVTIGSLFGILHVGGGRNLWAFVEVDTIALDCVLIFAIWYCGRYLSRYRRATPLFVMVLIVLVATAVPMAYTVTNFGTMFRLRGMLYTLAAVLPLTLAGVTTPAPPLPDRDA
jgi:hypothetical protein